MNTFSSETLLSRLITLAFKYPDSITEAESCGAKQLVFGGRWTFTVSEGVVYERDLNDDGTLKARYIIHTETKFADLRGIVIDEPVANPAPRTVSLYSDSPTIDDSSAAQGGGADWDASAESGAAAKVAALYAGAGLAPVSMPIGWPQAIAPWEQFEREDQIALVVSWEASKREEKEKAAAAAKKKASPPHMHLVRVGILDAMHADRANGHDIVVARYVARKLFEARDKDGARVWGGETPLFVNRPYACMYWISVDRPDMVRITGGLVDVNFS